MNEGVNGPVCQCGADMDMYHGVTVCPHCDCGGCQGGCPNCRKYQYQLSMRVINEHNVERKARRDGAK